VSVAESGRSGSAEHRGRALRAALALAALLALACAGPGRAAAAERPPFWSGAIPIDPGTGSTGEFTGLSCTSASVCVALDAAGNLLTTTNPSGVGGEWTRTHLEGAEQPENFTRGEASCASSTLCVFVGGPVGGVFASTDPLGGPSAWTQETIDVGALTDIACVAPSLCVAADGHGDVLTSTNPVSGAGAWTLHDVDGSEAIYSVSCASPSLCVAVDALGRVLSSTNPTSDEWQPASLPWPKPPVPPEVQGLHVSCVQGGLCVVAGQSAIFASADPAGGASAWTADDSADGSGGVSCDAAFVCVAFPGNTNGQMITTDDPTGGSGSWSADGAGFRPMSEVSCISSSNCVAVDPFGNEFVSTQAHLLSVSLLGSATGSVGSTPIACPFLTCLHEVPGLIEPAPIEGIACGNTLGPTHLVGGTCGVDYPWSDTTSLTATPATGAVFAGWSGACAGASGCSLSMSEDRAVRATFAPAGPPPPNGSAGTIPRISSLHESNRAFAVARQPTQLRAATARRRPRGTLFSFALDRPATVDIEIGAVASGARVGHRCESARKLQHRARRCTLYVKVATLVREGHAGLNHVAFSGRISAKAMGPGGYRAAFTARDAAGVSAAQYLSFTVLGG